MCMPLLFRQQEIRQQEHLAVNQREFWGLMRKDENVEYKCRTEVD